MKSAHNRKAVSLALRYLVLSIASVLSLGPLIYMILTSLRENAFVLVSPVDVVTGTKSFANYVSAWIDGDLSSYFLNSLLVSTVTTIGVVTLGSMMAYGFARFEFPGKNALFAIVIGCQMIPAIMLIIPQFILAKNLDVLDSRQGLILFYIGSNLAFNTFLLRGFFEGIPRELEEAMIMDGAGVWRRYTRLILPLARPALATAAIFSFLGSWDEYVWAVTIITDPAYRTLPMGIAMFAG